MDIVRFVMCLVHEEHTVDVCVTVGVCLWLWLCDQILPVSGWTRPCWPVMGAVGRRERVWRYWVWQSRALRHLPAEHWIPLHIARGTCQLFDNFVLTFIWKSSLMFHTCPLFNFKCLSKNADKKWVNSLMTCTTLVW